MGRSAGSIATLDSKQVGAELNAVLARFQQPSTLKAIWQLIDSLALYVLMWVLIYWSLKGPPLVSVVITCFAGLLVVRVFIIMHDCGHGSFVRSKLTNDVIGVIAGMIVFTPYYHWRWEHAIHHATSGNLDRRGTGDIWTMTVKEYLQSSTWMRLLYRIARHPLVLFGIGPVFLFLILNRFPSRKAKPREWWSVWCTNAWFVCVVFALTAVIGWKAYLLVQLAITIIGGGIGIWMFYVQHQFEGGYWACNSKWSYFAAALQGSSFYRLPKILQWFSGNIGFHHIHHLSPRIPNYNLARCHSTHPVFKSVPTLTLRNSFNSCRLKLWDEQQRRLVSFRGIRR